MLTRMGVPAVACSGHCSRRDGSLDSAVQTGWKAFLGFSGRGAPAPALFVGYWPGQLCHLVSPGTTLTATRVPHRELEKQRESTASDILQKKQEAEAAVRGPTQIHIHPTH